MQNNDPLGTILLVSVLLLAAIALYLVFFHQEVDR